MPVSIDTETPRLSQFEDRVLAELMRLQCREAELVATIQQLQAEAAEQAEADDDDDEHERALELVKLRTEVGRLTVENENLRKRVASYEPREEVNGGDEPDRPEPV